MADTWLLTQTHERALAIVLAAAAAISVAGGLRAARSVFFGGLVVCGALTTAAAGFWIGANSSRVTWFGSLVSTGSRADPRVALTFDDGPNVGTTLAVRDVLDAAGVKGTFFEVGKAVDARPDIAKALVADGQLLGNHSYLHDDRSWLDPRYPELTRAEQAIRRDVGVCPAYFRPPHGRHTPFMASVVRRHAMRMVTWDVSAGDWATTDATRLAARILAQVRPGSIIDLHDGLDGDLVADRSVVVRALPLILDGLAQKGLKPVRLDELIGGPAYLASC